MPALEVETYARPALGHVNLMTDTLIANASPDDLRTIVRSLLATSPPSVSASFASVARGCLSQSLQRHHARSSALQAVSMKTAPLFEVVVESALVDKGFGGVDGKKRSHGTTVVPTPALTHRLAYARTLYGAGMGFASLDFLTDVVSAVTEVCGRASSSDSLASSPRNSPPSFASRVFDDGSDDGDSSSPSSPASSSADTEDTAIDALESDAMDMDDDDDDADDALTFLLATIDADISQAIQSCREELLNGLVVREIDASGARASLKKLKGALAECRAETENEGKEFPFVRGSANAECLQF